MKLYYRAVSQDGKTVRGLVDAKDVKEAAFYLRKHQLTPIKILEANKSGTAQLQQFFRRTSNGDVIYFTRQTASMISSGLTLMQALQVMKNQALKPAMNDVISGIIADVENGSTLSSALEKFPKVFSPIYIALIKTGESAGLLDKVLTRLADNMEKQQKLKSTIKSAMMYPVIVVVMMVAVMTIMMIFVVPQLSSLYGNLNIELPFTTRVVVAISNFSVNYWPIVIVGLVGSVVLSRKWYKSESGRKLIDAAALRIPVLGKLLSESMTAEFTRTLGLLIGSGSLVVDSLTQTSLIVNNVHYQAAIDMVSKRVEKGISVGDAMESSPIFPPMVVEMVKIGEQTGKLDESLLRVSEYFEREVEQSVKTLTTLMEPLIMVCLALGVGFLIFAVITPIYNLMSAL
jgi:type II secretory pathway component PulF